MVGGCSSDAALSKPAPREVCMSGGGGRGIIRRLGEGGVNTYVVRAQGGLRPVASCDAVAMLCPDAVRCPVRAARAAGRGTCCALMLWRDAPCCAVVPYTMRCCAQFVLPELLDVARAVPASPDTREARVQLARAFAETCRTFGEGGGGEGGRGALVRGSSTTPPCKWTCPDPGVSWPPSCRAVPCPTTS